MKSGDLATGTVKLDRAWKKLLTRWERTKLDWHDPVSEEFERNCLEMLDPRIRTTLERMRTLAAMLGRADHECQDPRD